MTTRDGVAVLIAALRDEATPELSQYEAFDREEKLGPSPWNLDDEKVVAWQQAHGHDPRMKCYPEFGCQVTGAKLARLAIDAADALEAAINPGWLAKVIDPDASITIDLDQINPRGDEELA